MTIQHMKISIQLIQLIQHIKIMKTINFKNVIHENVNTYI